MTGVSVGDGVALAVGAAVAANVGVTAAAARVGSSAVSSTTDGSDRSRKATNISAKITTTAVKTIINRCAALRFIPNYSNWRVDRGRWWLTAYPAVRPGPPDTAPIDG